MNLKLCPNCKANVEGLISRCNCCGALLNKKSSFFIWHTYMTPESGDLQFLTKQIFAKIEDIDTLYYNNYIQNVIFEIFCYPPNMINNMTNKVIYYSSKKKCHIKIIISYDNYISSSLCVKTSLITDGIKFGMNTLSNRLKYYRINIDDLVKDVFQKIT